MSREMLSHPRSKLLSYRGKWEGGWRERRKGVGVSLEKKSLAHGTWARKAVRFCATAVHGTLRLPGRESTRRVEAGKCKDSESTHSHIKGGLLLHLLLLHTVMTTAKYLVKRVERSVLTRESFRVLCSETPSY